MPDLLPVEYQEVLWESPNGTRLYCTCILQTFTVLQETATGVEVIPDTRHAIDVDVTALDHPEFPLRKQCAKDVLFQKHHEAVGYA